MKQSSILRSTAVALMLAASAHVTLAAPAGLPPVQHAGDISYLSGGVGSDQSAAIKSAMRHYPLALEFVGKTNGGNDYLADIPVQISDAHGTVLLNANARGPFMLVSLPHGRYTVTASYDGKQERRTVSVASAAHTQEMFVWPMQTQ
jgi:hypothetical protein